MAALGPFDSFHLFRSPDLGAFVYLSIALESPDKQKEAVQTGRDVRKGGGGYEEGDGGEGGGRKGRRSCREVKRAHRNEEPRSGKN